MSLTFNDDAIALIDGNLVPLAVSQSQVITAASQSGYIQMGVSGSTALYMHVNSAGDLFVTGSLTSIPSGIQTITGSVTVNNFPITQSVKIDQTIILPVSVSNFPTIQTVTGTVHFDNANLPVSVSNFPSVQTVTGSVSLSEIAVITGSVTVNNPTVFPTTQSVKLVDIGTNVTQSVTGTVSVNNFPSIQTISGTVHFDNANLPVSVSNFPSVQIITGSVGISQIVSITGSTAVNNFPVTQSVKIDQSITLPITGTVHFDNVNLPVSVSNFPSVQTITGSVTVNNPVSTVNQGISGSTSWLVTGSFFQINQPVTQSIKIDQSITLPVSVSNFPVSQTITGSVTVNNPISAVIQGTSGSIPWKVLFNDGVTTFGSASANPIWITGSVTQNNFPVTQSIKIDQSITLPVSVSNLPTIQTITGTVHFDNINLPISVSNFPNIQTITGSVNVNGLTFVSGSNLSVFITSSNTLPVTGTVHFDNVNFPLSVSNFPTTQSVKIDSWFGSTLPFVGQKVMTASLPVVIASDQFLKLFGYTYSSFSPNPSNYAASTQTPITLDGSKRLETHSTVLTDEGSFRDDFPGTSLSSSLTGTATFTNGSAVISGIGSIFLTEVLVGQWIKKTTDSEVFFAQVESVGNDSTVSLSTAYTGTTATATATISDWLTVTPTGGSIIVANSLVSIGSGTANGATGYIRRAADYNPYTLSVMASISQRIANQTTIIGFRDTFATTNKQAIVSFTGTSNTQVNFITSFSSAAVDTQTTSVTLPNGATTNNLNVYKIDVSGTQVTLSINGIVVAIHQQHIPGPYDSMDVYAGTLNSAVVTATTLAIDYYYFSNVDRIQIDNDFQGEPITVQGLISNGQPVSGSPLLAAGSDGTNVRTFKTATDGTLFITGSISTVSSNPSVAGNNAAIPLSSSLAGGSDGTNLRPIKVLTDGTQVITGSINGLTFVSGSNLSVFITGSNTLPVSVSNFPATQTITGSVGISQVVTITGSVTQNNFPVTQSIKIDQSITLPVSVSNFPSVQTITGSTLITLSSASYGGQVEGRTPNAAVVVGNPVLIAGSDGTNVYTIETDKIGRVRTTYPSITTYAGSSNGTVGSGTAATTVTSVGYIWHTAANAKRIEIYCITVSTGGGAAGNLSLRGAFITAENATPGGLVYPPTPLDRSSAASTVTGSTGILRVGAAAPTRVVGDLITENIGGASTGTQYTLFDSSKSGQPIILRSGSAEGFEIRSVIGVALTTATQISFTAYWTEV